MNAKCKNWTDSWCSRPQGHEPPCYSQDDGMVWRDATDEEVTEFQAEKKAGTPE